MRKLKLCYVILISLTCYCLGQSSNEFVPQNIDVPNPEVYSFLKNNIWANSMTSGLLNLNIPIHSLKLDDKKLNIGFSYNSSTPNVIEKGGVLGLGWTMSNYFKITRVKNQTPDDLPYGFIHENINTVSYVNSVCGLQNSDSDCLHAESLYDEGKLDLESDKYIVNLPFGDGFEFMFNQERSTTHPYGNIIKFPYDKDLKITPLIEGYEIIGWVVKDKLGYSYEFSQGDEYLNIYNYTHSNNNDLGIESVQTNDDYITSWILTKIVSPNNNLINFHYSSHLYEDCEFINQKKILTIDGEHSNKINTNYQKVRGRYMRIDSISNNNQKVEFNYNRKVGDADYYNLQNIIVSDYNSNNEKVYEFDYYITNSNFQGEIYGCNSLVDNNSINFRYFLKKIKEKGVFSDDFADKYSFNYYSIEDNSSVLPHRFSFAQDWWGKYNGANQNNILVFPFNSPYENNLPRPNRNVNEQYSKIGLLESVLNDLKGKETFFYEQNKGLYSENYIESIMPYQDKSVYFNSQFNYYDTLVSDDCNRCEILRMPFHIGNNISIQYQQNEYGNVLEVINLKMNGETTSCDYGGDLPLHNSCAVWFRILEDDNEKIGWELLRNGDDRTFPLIYERTTNEPIIHDHNYILEVKIDKGLSNQPGNQIFDMENDQAKIKFTYKELTDDVDILEDGKYIIPVGGMRLDYVESKDKDVLLLKKQYEYKLDNGFDAGYLDFKLNYESFALRGKVWSISSNNNFPLITSSNSPIIYTNIIEKNISNIVNQKSINKEYKYSFVPSTTYGDCYYVHDSKYMMTSPCFKNPMNGKIKSIKFKNNKNRNYDINIDVRNKSFAYDNFFYLFEDIQESQFIEGIDYDRHISIFEVGFWEAVTQSANTNIFDFYYKIYSFPDVREKKIITSDFFGSTFLSSMSLKEEFIYDSIKFSYEPKMIISKYSQDKKKYQKLHYPQDLKSQGIQPLEMERLISENRIGEPVMTETFVNDKKISSTITKFGEFNGGEFLLPQEVYSAKGEEDIKNFDLDNRKISYDKYDSRGNILQYTMENGIPISVVWGYGEQYPIAKIEGIAYDIIDEGFINELKYLSNLDNTTSVGITGNDPESRLRKRLHEFQTNGLFKKAMVTTYTYDPLIGVTSITPPTGQTAYYQYDAMGRLESIKDEAGNTLQDIEYNYKN